MPKGKVAEAHNWDKEQLTVNQIAERVGLSPQSVYRLVQMGCDNTEEALSIMKPKPRRSRAEILASLPKVIPPSPATPASKEAPENSVIIQNVELDKLLTYLSKTTKSSYQDAFNEFMLYLYEGRRWSKEFAQEAIDVIKARLCHPDEMDNQSYEDYQDAGKAPKHLRIAELLEPYIVKLEDENATLKERLAKIMAILGNE